MQESNMMHQDLEEQVSLNCHWIAFALYVLSKIYMHFMWSSILDLRILSYFLAIYICAHFFPQFGPLNKNKYFFLPN